MLVIQCQNSVASSAEIFPSDAGPNGVFMAGSLLIHRSVLVIAEITLDYLQKDNNMHCV